MEDLPKISGPAVVVGSSPSVTDFDVFSFPGFRLGVGDMPWRAPELGPYNTWVCANSHFPLPWLTRHERAIRRSNAQALVLATLVFGQLTPSRAESAIKRMRTTTSLPPITAFDQRHFGGRLCTPIKGCCVAAVSLDAGTPLQERLRDISVRRETYSGSQSVAFHGIALAVLLGADPIYVAGIDLPSWQKDYRHLHAKRVAPSGTFRQSVQRRVTSSVVKMLTRTRESAFTHQAEMISDLEILARIVNESGRRIINTSRRSLLVECEGIQTL